VLEYLIDRVKGKAPKGTHRSGEWQTYRNIYVIDHPICVCCESEKNLVVHHIIPFYIAPHLELVESNLVTLCESKKYGVNCHLLFGHFGNYQRFNPMALATVHYWNSILKDGSTRKELEEL